MKHRPPNRKPMRRRPRVERLEPRQLLATCQDAFAVFPDIRPDRESPTVRLQGIKSDSDCLTRQTSLTLRGIIEGGSGDAGKLANVQNFSAVEIAIVVAGSNTSLGSFTFGDIENKTLNGINNGRYAVGQNPFPLGFEVNISLANRENQTTKLEISGRAPTAPIQRTAKSESFSIEHDSISPTLGVIPNPASPRVTAVAAVPLAFSEPIDPATFGRGNITLKRGSEEIQLGSSVVVSPTRISGLSSHTATPGNYELIVSIDGVRDVAGNSASGSRSIAWTVSRSNAPDLDGEDDSGRSNADNVTNPALTAQNDLTFTGTVFSDVREVSLVVRGTGIEVKKPASGDRYEITIPPADVQTLGSGTYDVFARYVGADGQSSESESLSLTIDRQNPPAPGLELASDTNASHIGADDGITRADPLVFNIGAEVDHEVELRRDGVDIQSAVPAEGSSVSSLQDDTAAEGTHTYQAIQEDLAGNRSDPTTLIVAVDRTDPVLEAIRLASSDRRFENGTVLPIPVTENTSPTIEVVVRDQMFRTKSNVVSVQVTEGISGVSITKPATFTAGSDNSQSATVAFPLEELQPGVHHFTVTATDAAGNSASTVFTFFVSRPGAPTPAAPNTPVFTMQYDLEEAFGDDVYFPWQTAFDRTTQTTWFTMEHGNKLGQFDPATGLTRIWDLEKLNPSAGLLTAPVTAGSSVIQTSSRLSAGAKYILALGTENDETVTVVDVQGSTAPFTAVLQAPLTKTHAAAEEIFDSKSVNNPHGLFFDFNNHLTPRVWFVHRATERGRDAGQQAPAGPARLSYLDVVSNEIVIYDFGNHQMKELLGDPPTSLHATFVDARGHVWGISDRDGSVLEFNFDRRVPGTDVHNLDGDEPLLTIRKIPEPLTEHFHPHGVEVVIDDQTGEAYVWIIAAGGSGRVALLRPGKEVTVVERTAPNQLLVDAFVEVGSEISVGGAIASVTRVTRPEPNAGPPAEPGTYVIMLDRSLPQTGNGDIVEVRDRWSTWDVPDAAEETRGTFVKIDDSETPGNPLDDKILATFPVKQSANPADATGVIYSLSPLFDPTPGSALRSGQSIRGADIRGWQIEALPGTGENRDTPFEFAAINQPYVDREGTIFFVDRFGAVGRIDPERLQPGFPATESDTITLTTPVPTPFDLSRDDVPIRRVSVDAIDALDEDAFREQVLRPQLLTGEESKSDRAQATGLDLYRMAGPDVRGPVSAGFGAGAFRGFLNAANVLYGAITQNELLSTTIFAESARRQLAVVHSPGSQPGAAVDARIALQVAPDGQVVMTARGDGTLIDRQVNLTRMLAVIDGGRGAEARSVHGDMAAVALADGSVVAFGRARTSSNPLEMLAFKFSPGSTTWTTSQIFDAANWQVIRLQPPQAAPNVVLAADPVAVGLFGETSARALVTTNEGHLLMYDPELPQRQPVNLTATVRQGLAAQSSRRVYSSVGYTNALIDGIEHLFLYGTNQTGQLIEYSLATEPNTMQLDPDASAVRRVALWRDANNPTSAGGREFPDPNNAEHLRTMVFQNVSATTVGQTRHVFAGDGRSRLVHVEITGTSDNVNNVTATNVSHDIAQTVDDNVVTEDGLQRIGGEDIEGDDRAFGYAHFQLPFVGRIYTYATPLTDEDGTLRLYGTEGQNLIQFTRRPGDQWEVANLTQDVLRGRGRIITVTDPDTGAARQIQERMPGNFVFGAPDSYLDDQGQQHVMLINADGELIEYYTMAGVEGERFQTFNTTLALGNSLAELIAPSKQDTAVDSEQRTESTEQSATEASFEEGPANVAPTATNHMNPLDVNNDGTVSAIDALLGINWLNGGSDGPPPSGMSSFFWDVNADRLLSPLDSLLVINALNRAATGEAESALPAPEEGTGARVPASNRAGEDNEQRARTPVLVEPATQYPTGDDRKRQDGSGGEWQQVEEPDENDSSTNDGSTTRFAVVDQLFEQWDAGRS